MDTKPIVKALGGPTGHFPVEAEIVGYLANSFSVPALLGLFAVGWVLILGTTNLLVKRHNSTLGPGDRNTILWFVLSELNQFALLPSQRADRSASQRDLYICSLKVGLNPID